MAMMRFTRHLNKAGLKVASLVKKIAVGLLIVISVFFAGRIYETQRGPALHSWHTWSADEMSAAEIDRTTFGGYLAREGAIFQQMKTQLTDALPDNEKTPLNRFYAQSEVYPEKFQPNWNRSFVLLPPAPRQYSTTVITNASPTTYETVARTTPAGEKEERVTPLNLAWPQDMYSLSHVAVPFPLNDSLYGREPTEKSRYGISIGTISLRGETSSLSVGLDTLMRVTSNPFFPFMMARIDQRIGCGFQPDMRACLQSEARVEASK
ncbi:hypothetical protein QFJ66_25310 [Raoultella terrigena]|uniref:hypothetical protein n=1 Tax=Raoultella terrigena TaxID=577 RepID=UPI002F91CFBD